MLAIDPVPRRYGYAVLEGTERLVSWGSVEIRSSETRRFVELLYQFAPDCLVIEDPLSDRRRAEAHELQRLLVRAAVAECLGLVRVSRDEVHREFWRTGTTAYEIAVAVAGQFSELGGRLPRARSHWASGDERSVMFGAVSLAVTAVSSP